MNVTAERDVYGDCEFIRTDMSNRGLIAVGLTDREGHDYYAVNAQMDYAAVQADPFLRAEVWPKLPRTAALALDRSHQDVKPVTQIRDEIAAYFSAGPTARLWAYYGADDMIRIRGLWQHKWDEIPPAVPRRVRELADDVEDYDIAVPLQDTPQHHALNDARHGLLIHQTVDLALGRARPVGPPANTLDQLRALLTSSLARSATPGVPRTPEELADALPAWALDDIGLHAPELAALRSTAQAATGRHRTALASWISAICEEPTRSA